jgi:hypothetical protein
MVYHFRRTLRPSANREPGPFRTAIDRPPTPLAAGTSSLSPWARRRDGMTDVTLFPETFQQKKTLGTSWKTRHIRHIRHTLHESRQGAAHAGGHGMM